VLLVETAGAGPYRARQPGPRTQTALSGPPSATRTVATGIAPDVRGRPTDSRISIGTLVIARLNDVSQRSGLAGASGIGLGVVRGHRLDPVACC
jgi:hypothetical protein